MLCLIRAPLLVYEIVSTASDILQLKCEHCISQLSIKFQ